MNHDPPANLHVLYNTIVSRIVLEPITGSDGPTDPKPSTADPHWAATGVEAHTLVIPASNPDLTDEAPPAVQRSIKVLKARKEVVLSAGAYNSPVVLMHSGIGPKEHIEEVGIPGGCKVDLPYVGSNLDDHPLVFNFYQLNSNMT